MVLKIITLTLSLACFASFSWGVQRFFERPSRLRWQMKLIIASGSIFALDQFAAILRRVGTVDALWFAGSVLFIVSFGLFWWSVTSCKKTALNIAFTITNPQRLLKAGPYARIRHPFYASYLCYWIAGVLVTQWWPLVVTVIVMAGLYYSASRREEREFLSGSLATEYNAYRRGTGLFWPRLGDTSKSER